MVCSIEGFILVTKVKPYSVAGEDDKVEEPCNPVQDGQLTTTFPTAALCQYRLLSPSTPIFSSPEPEGWNS